ncbi:universal stress protein (plasmid) [Halarchaeum sp. CBA1220]|uniref:universal stress protein n=1 Tax=Halarchaeum sp. CBA1220 TaxID=1853682 RepID=UPI000F3A9076|nr:universal stress protein [Halarchaeum sp. CBA1220]QLC35014.1 universal stress protein [Halarchaeum sp. CBA1220]
MYSRLLCPTDGSDVSATAIESAVELAAQLGADVTVRHVRTGDDGGLDGAALVPEGVAARADDLGVALESAVVDADGPVHEAILRHAEEAGADCVVMGTHGRTGLERLRLGSVTERTLRESTLPVLTVRGDTALDPDVERVLVPTDGSGYAEAAARDAITLAGETSSALHVVHAVDPGTFAAELSTSTLEAFENAGKEAVAAIADAAESDGVRDVETAVLTGSPVTTIVEYASEHDVDCIVMGTHGRTGVSRVLLGSVAARVVRLADVPVLVVPSPEGVEEE